MYFCLCLILLFFSLHLLPPFFLFCFLCILHRYIVRSDCLSLSAVSCREATVCLMLAFLHFSNALYLFFVPFVLCDFVARRPHPFFASCFLSFCLSLSFGIEISCFALALALSLFYPIPTNE